MRCWFGVLHSAVFWCECVVCTGGKTHSGCHCCVVWSKVGAHSRCRAGSSRHDVSVLWVLVIDKKLSVGSRVGSHGLVLGVLLRGAFWCYMVFLAPSMALGAWSVLVPLLGLPLASMVVCM